MSRRLGLLTLPPPPPPESVVKSPKVWQLLIFCHGVEHAWAPYFCTLYYCVKKRGEWSTAFKCRGLASTRWTKQESTFVFHNLGKCGKLSWQQLSTYSSPSLYLRTLVPCFSSFPSSLSFMNSYVCVRYFIKNQWPYSAHCHSTRHPRPLMYSGELLGWAVLQLARVHLGVSGDFIERCTLPYTTN
jgi:hypothetical protein